MGTHLTRQQIFAEAAKLLRQEFERLSLIPHKGMKGDAAESIVRDFLNGHLPQRWRAGSGLMLGFDGEVSKQTDVIIYDALNCPIYRISQSDSIFPTDNVAAVVEVKSTLDKPRLEEAIENLAAAKALSKTKTPNDGDSSLAIMTCLFAYKSSIGLEKVIEHLHAWVKGRGIGHHIDVVAVLDRGIVTWMVQMPNEPAEWAPALIHGLGHMEGAHVALGAHETGLDTLDAFLRFLVPHLNRYRNLMVNPHLEWHATASSGEAMVKYVNSIALDPDPEKRKADHQRYQKEMAERIRVYRAARGSET